MFPVYKVAALTLDGITLLRFHRMQRYRSINYHPSNFLLLQRHVIKLISQEQIDVTLVPSDMLTAMPVAMAH